MNLITTHSNSDFDALASLVAAKKIYPDSVLLLPGSQEKSVRRFLSLTKDKLEIKQEKECKYNGYERLIIVDTRLIGRIGKASRLVDMGIPVTIIDHHPRSRFDIVADKDIYENVGATITILVEKIKNLGLKLDPIEATLFALGIYEETGNFTFNSTTQKDIEMAGYLLSKGANLGVVSTYLNTELDNSELLFLSTLIHQTQSYCIKGVNIAIVTAEASTYLGELGNLVHKLLEVENYHVIFLIVKSHTKTHLIARSRIPSVDVNKILQLFGGGGHATAASATLKNSEPEDIKSALLKNLESHIKINILAKDLMTKLPRMLNSSEKISKVKKYFKIHNLESLPVISRNNIKGVVSIDKLNEGLASGFGGKEVKRCISTNFYVIKPNTPLFDIQRIIYEKNTGHIIVADKGKPVGMIERSNILKVLFKDLFKKTHKGSGIKPLLNVSDKIYKSFPGSFRVLLRKISKLSSVYNMPVYIVGGLVRDLILGIKDFDLDLVVEGDGISFAKILAIKLNGALVIHKNFGTASLYIDRPHDLSVSLEETSLYRHTRKKFKIDIATARTEIYKKPAMLPEVKFGSLRSDLYRRDFTINAMAASLSRKDFGDVVDFFGGINDLNNKTIRVLHDNSFIDDPTRILRAIRFEQRFAFKLSGPTKRLLLEASGKKMLETTGKHRIKDEINLILKEKKSLKILIRLDRLIGLDFLHKNLIFNKTEQLIFNDVIKLINWYNISLNKRPLDIWLVLLMALIDKLSLSETRSFAKEFGYSRSESIRLISNKTLGLRASGILSSRTDVLPSRIYQTLEPLSFESIIFLLAKNNTRSARARVHQFFSRLNSTHTFLKGTDLKNFGLTPGPQFKVILNKILVAKLNGKIVTKEDEIAFLKKIAKINN